MMAVLKLSVNPLFSDLLVDCHCSIVACEDSSIRRGGMPPDVGYGE